MNRGRVRCLISFLIEGGISLEEAATQWREEEGGEFSLEGSLADQCFVSLVGVLDTCRHSVHLIFRECTIHVGSGGIRLGSVLHNKLMF